MRSARSQRVGVSGNSPKRWTLGVSGSTHRQLRGSNAEPRGKLREAVEIADCLSIDLQQLLMPAGPDPLSMVLELRRFAEKRMRSGRFAFAELGHYARAMQEILEVRPEARDRLRRLRGRSERLTLTNSLLANLKTCCETCSGPTRILKLKTWMSNSAAYFNGW